MRVINNKSSICVVGERSGFTRSRSNVRTTKESILGISGAILDQIEKVEAMDVDLDDEYGKIREEDEESDGEEMKNRLEGLNMLGQIERETMKRKKSAN